MSDQSAKDFAVVAQGLTKRFGDFTAVDNVDLQVPTGTVFSLLGPNGAGKTTMVRMLTTLSAPNSGTATVGGYDIVHDADKVRSIISLTGQFAALESLLTARENLVLMARLRGFSNKAAGKIADDLIERFDIVEFKDKLVKSVSGGQRRRIDLAASLVIKPQLLVLDEPTTGLDPRSRQAVWNAVKELVADGVTLLLTTQYLEEADELADYVMLIDHGRSVAAGTPSELKAQIGDQRVEVTTIDTEGFETLSKAFQGNFETSEDSDKKTISIPAPNEAEDLVRVTNAVLQANVRIDEIALKRPTLDDAFLALTGKGVGE